MAFLSPDLKYIEIIWDVLEETLQSAGLLDSQYKILSKNVCALDGKKHLKTFDNIYYNS